LLLAHEFPSHFARLLDLLVSEPLERSAMRRVGLARAASDLVARRSVIHVASEYPPMIQQVEGPKNAPCVATMMVSRYGAVSDHG